MSVAIIKSKKVEKHNDVFILHVGFKHYDLGVQIHSWGVRFMFIWWHVCVHLKLMKKLILKFSLWLYYKLPKRKRKTVWEL